MKIDRVTITGADDTTDVRDLLALSAEYPFVEWGILLGSGVTLGMDRGGPRFPSHGWMDRLVAAATDTPMRLSLHLCGRYVRAACAGKDLTALNMISRWVWARCQRVQLNFHAIAHHVDVALAAGQLRDWPEKQWIFQLDGVNNHVFAAIAGHRSNAVPLFDRSGGAGLVPSEWPTAWPRRYCGYAGGLGPDTLPIELPKIAAVAGGERIWIDMERRVRTPDDSALDMDKVRAVLAFMSLHITTPLEWDDGDYIPLTTPEGQG